MNAIANPQSGDAISPPAEPVLSQALDLQITLSAKPDPLASPPAITASTVAEARKILPAMCDYCRPPDRHHLREWCKLIVGGVAQPPDAAHFALRVGAIAEACGHFPAAVFTRQTAAEALRLFRWYPTAAEVHTLLEPHAAPIMRKLDALRRLANASPITKSDSPRQPPSEEEKAAVRAIIAGSNLPTAQAPARPAQTAAHRPGRLPETHPAIVLGGAVMAARSGSEAARYRVEVQRKRLLIPDDVSCEDWLVQRGIVLPQVGKGA